MAKHTLYHELREALQTPGCAICGLVAKAVERFAAGVIYEYANDGAVQQDVLRSRGWCTLHAWQLAHQTGAGLDVAILYRPTVQALIGSLRDYEKTSAANGPHRVWDQLQRAVGLPGAPPTATLLAGVTPEALCPACSLRAQSERAYLQTLLEHIDDPEVAEAFSRAGGLCWPHFRTAVEQRPAELRLRALAALQRDAAERLLADLEEFIRKHDYRFHDEPMTTEGDAWLRAVAQVSGTEGVW